MKTTLKIACLAAILGAGNLYAATTAGKGGEIGVAGWLFIGFMALIVVMQLIPAVMMFGSMMSAIFTRTKKLEGLSAKK